MSDIQVNSQIDKAERIRNMFGNISGRYDLMNDLISLGMLHRWRDILVQKAAPQKGEHILDCASGTGDVAIAFQKALNDSGHVIGSDYCMDMLRFAPAKAKAQNLTIQFEQADVTALPYASGSFDIVSIAFGIRNVPNLDQGLRELARVARKDCGRVLILETGQPTNPLMRVGYRAYFKTVMPLVAGALSGDRKAYDYLQKTSAEFPYGTAFQERAMSTGAFKSMEVQALSGGLVYLYTGSPA